MQLLRLVPLVALAPALLGISQPREDGSTALNKRAYRLLYRDWRLTAALEAFQRAIRSDPRDPVARIGHSEALTAAGRHRLAVSEAAIAVRLDDGSAITLAHYGRALFFARRYREATVPLTRAAQKGDEPMAHVWLAWSYDQLGLLDLAIEQHRHAIAAAGPHRMLAAGSLGRSLARRGDGPAARAILSELEQRGADGLVSAALVASALGERDRAFDLLDRAVAARDPQALLLAVNPHWDGLRSSTKFKALVHAVQSPRELSALKDPAKRRLTWH